MAGFVAVDKSVADFIKSCFLQEAFTLPQVLTGEESNGYCAV